MDNTISKDSIDIQCEIIKKKAQLSEDFKPEIALILGSGLGDFADKLDIVGSVDYGEIPDMPTSTAPSHKGRFIFAKCGGKGVVIMQGRVHLYEGYSPSQIAIPIRIMKRLGAKKIILTNAAGGINRNFSVGDFMLIKDHISCFIDSPLIGKNDKTIGTRFPDMSNAYDKNIRRKIKHIAMENNIKLQEGVYVQLKGPQFESPAEIKMLSVLGADAVGMSTVTEAIAAVHCSMKVCAISLITNYACGILDKPLTSEEVNEAAAGVSEKFSRLIENIIREI